MPDIIVIIHITVAEQLFTLVINSNYSSIDFNISAFCVSLKSLP